MTGRIEAELAKLSYDLVRVMMTGHTKRPTLQIMAERRDGQGMTVEDCAAISKVLEPMLEDDKDLIAVEALEVSSPGIDRPLVRPQDYTRSVGHEARIDLNEALDGRRKLLGKILGLMDGEIGVRLKTSEGEVAVPFTIIARAKLELTDALIKAHQKAERQG